jgi:hypothetical protein
MRRHLVRVRERPAIRKLGGDAGCSGCVPADRPGGAGRRIIRRASGSVIGLSAARLGRLIPGPIGDPQKSHRRRIAISALITAGVTGRRPDEMTEPILRAVAEGDTPPDGPACQDDAERRRFRREFWSLIFLTAVAIIGVASTISLFGAGFDLLMHQRAAVRPAAPSLARGTAPVAPAPVAAVKPNPPRVAALPAPAATAEPPPAAASFALPQGDANFAAGRVPVARFYYEQAVDGGDAGAAVRMGETFDPAFLPLGHLRSAYADPEAARFWYQRAFALGAVEAEERLAELETQPAESGTTPTARSERSRHRAAATRRYDRHACPPATTFPPILGWILHPCR